MSAQPESTNTIDRTVPQALIELALTAIRRGAQTVSLGYSGLGYDFAAPIGCTLRIQGADELGYPLGLGYGRKYQVGSSMDDFILSEKYIQAEDQPVPEAILQLFEAGVRNGWSVEYERRLTDQIDWEAITGEKRPLRHSLRARAFNWDQAASNDPDSVEARLTMNLGEEPHPLAYTNIGGTHRQTVQSHVTALLNTRAPHSVPLAYYDEDLDCWVK